VKINPKLMFFSFLLIIPLVYSVTNDNNFYDDLCYVINQQPINIYTNVTSYNATYDSYTVGSDTNASTACAGTTTYLDGEGNCDDISGVYLTSYTEVDALWYANYTAMNSTWNSTYNITYDAGVTEVDALWYANYTAMNSTWNTTYNSTYDAKPDNVYNSSYEYWDNATLMDTYNSSYEYYQNATLLDTYNITYDSKPDNVYNSTYEWFLNTTIFQVYNSTYEWFLNTTIFQTYNSTYDSFNNHAHDQDLNTTDDVIFNTLNSTANAYFFEDIFVGNYIYEEGDTGTFIQFPGDRHIHTYAGGYPVAEFIGGSPKGFLLLGDGVEEVDLIVYGSTNQELLHVDSVLDEVNITGLLNVNGSTISNWFNGTFNWTTTDEWSSFDGVVFDFNESQLATVYYNASTIEVVTGTGAGTIDLLQVYDQITYNVTEANSDIDFRVNFTGITEFTTLLVRHKADIDAGHISAIQIWDYDTETWEGYGYLTESTTAEIKTLGVYDDTDHIEDGVVSVRFFQEEVGNAGHIHQFDWVAISKGFGTPVGQEIDPLSIHRNGNTTLTGNWDVGNYNITGYEWMVCNESDDNYNSSYEYYQNSTLLDTYNSSYEYWDNATLMDTYNSTYDTGLTEVDALWYANYTAMNSTWNSTYNSTYDAKPDNTYNSSYEYWNNATLMNTYNSSYEYYQNETLLKTYNVTYNALTPDTNASTACAGDTTYLDGEGNCDDISSVYLTAEVDPLWEANFTALNSTWNTTFNETYDTKPDNVYNSSYEYWDNATLMDTYNVTYDAFSDTANTSAEMITAVNITTYFQFQARNATDLICTNCIGGTEIDESTLTGIPTYNATYNTLINNDSYLTTYNSSYEYWDNATLMNTYNSSYEYYQNATLLDTYNVTYDSKPNNTYNSSYEYWTNYTLMNTYNSSYEYYQNETLLKTYNATYNALTPDTNASTACAGDTTYLSGEGNCNDISSVYLTTEYDSLWYANYTAMNSTWNSTYNSTYDAYVDTSNTTDEIFAVVNNETFLRKVNSTLNTVLTNDPLDWDAIGDVPTATPSDGDTTHLSLADEIYNWVMGLGFITNTFNTTYNALTPDTNASTACAGDTTYLDGEGNCDDISGVYLTSYTEVDNLWWANYTVMNSTWNTTYNVTYDAKPDNTYNSSYEYWNNATLMNTYNSSYEYWDNATLMLTYNSTYDSKPDDNYNSSYEYWDNATLMNTYNSSYEYYQNATLLNTYNSSYEYWTNYTLMDTYNSSYINKDGTVPLTDNWDVGEFNITAKGLNLGDDEKQCWGDSCDVCEYWNGTDLITESPCKG